MNSKKKQQLIFILLIIILLMVLLFKYFLKEGETYRLIYLNDAGGKNYHLLKAFDESHGERKVIVTEDKFTLYNMSTSQEIKVSGDTVYPCFPNTFYAKFKLKGEKFNSDSNSGFLSKIKEIFQKKYIIYYGETGKNTESLFFSNFLESSICDEPTVFSPNLVFKMLQNCQIRVEVADCKDCLVAYKSKGLKQKSGSVFTLDEKDLLFDFYITNNDDGKVYPYLNNGQKIIGMNCIKAGEDIRPVFIAKLNLFIANCEADNNEMLTNSKEVVEIRNELLNLMVSSGQYNLGNESIKEPVTFFRKLRDLRKTKDSENFKVMAISSAHIDANGKVKQLNIQIK